MNQKEEGLSIWVVLVFIFVAIYYTTSPVWYGEPVTSDGGKTITITSKRPMIVQQYLKEKIHTSGWGLGIGTTGACGELIPGYSISKSLTEPIFVIKIFKLD